MGMLDQLRSLLRRRDRNQPPPQAEVPTSAPKVVRSRPASGLLVGCEQCATRVPIEATYAGLCPACFIEERLGPDKVQYIRLARKKKRYRSAGASCRSVDEQLVRVIGRMQKRLGHMAPHLAEVMPLVVHRWLQSAEELAA